MKKWWITAHIITAALLLLVIWKEDYLIRAYRRITHTHRPPRTEAYDHYWYDEQIEYQAHYRYPAHIVMLGTSFTFRVQWQELLQRCDVVNRGIPSETTQGMLKRIGQVIDIHPRICFIEAGTNDIAGSVPYETITGNLRSVAAQLEAAHIKPVLATIPYLSVKSERFWPRNYQIYYLNARIRKMAADNHIDLIDLNGMLCTGMLTGSGYTTADGIHLSGAAYEKWTGAVREILRREGL